MYKLISKFDRSICGYKVSMVAKGFNKTQTHEVFLNYLVYKSKLKPV